MSEAKDEIIEFEQSESSPTEISSQVNPLAKSKFGEKMDDVKLEILNTSSSDETFVSTVQNNIKEAAVKSTQLEVEKVDLEKKTVETASKRLDKVQEKTKQEMSEDAWSNKEKRREFHYNGVKPMMMFVGIQEPMNLFMLYFLTLVLTIPFLISKLFKGTIGVLLCGACDANRPKAMKGFLWTVLAITVVIIIICGIYFFCKWQNINLFGIS